MEVCFKKVATTYSTTWANYIIYSFPVGYNKRGIRYNNKAIVAQHVQPSLQILFQLCYCKDVFAGHVIVHRLHHFFSSKSDLATAYPSLKHFHNAASHRSTFHETLLQIVHGIKQRTILPTISMSPSLSASSTEDSLTKRIDSRMKVVAWWTLSAGITPQRCIKQWYNKNLKNNAVDSWIKACTGVPV